MIIEESQGFMSPLDLRLISGQQEVLVPAEDLDDKIVVPLLTQGTQYIQSFLSQSGISLAKTSGWNMDLDQNNIPSQIHKSTHSNLHGSPLQIQVKSSYSQQQIQECIDQVAKDKGSFVKLRLDDVSSRSIVIESNSIKQLVQLHNLMALGSFAAQDSVKNQSFDNLPILNNQRLPLLGSFVNRPPTS